MSLARSKPLSMSREDYRRWYSAQPEGRFERHDGEIVAIEPECDAHLRMREAVFLALQQAIARAGARCEALTNGVTVETGDSDFEPDALVNCGDPMADNAIAAPNPAVVIEVSSPGPTLNDTGAKVFGYLRLAAVQHFLIVHPIKRLVIHHRRNGHVFDTFILSAGPVELHPPGLTLDLDELYLAP